MSERGQRDGRLFLLSSRYLTKSPDGMHPRQLDFGFGRDFEQRLELSTAGKLSMTLRSRINLPAPCLRAMTAWGT